MPSETRVATPECAGLEQDACGIVLEGADRGTPAEPPVPPGPIWKFDWLTPKKPGRYTLLAQAKDANGTVQPDKHDPNNGSYVINHPLPIEVFVDDPRGTSA